MANTFAPFGFAESGRLGAQPNYQISKRYILYNTPTPIFFGDPIVQLSSGYIAQASTPNAQIAGIFGGCTYMSISQKKIVESQWWPGTADVAQASGYEVAAKVIDDPVAVFRVATGPGAATGPLGQALVGATCAFAFGPSLTGGYANGNPSLNGVSTACIDMVTTPPSVVAGGNNYPFKVVEIIRDPPGANGTDPTTPFNWVYVTFNAQSYRVVAPL